GGRPGARWGRRSKYRGALLQRRSGLVGIAGRRSVAPVVTAAAARHHLLASGQTLLMHLIHFVLRDHAVVIEIEPIEGLGDALIRGGLRFLFRDRAVLVRVETLEPRILAIR